MVIITSKYLKPLEVLDALREEHRAFLAVHYKQQKLICSGPQNPRVGGAIIASVGIDEARFRRPVVPGDQLLLEARITRQIRGIWKFDARASVGDEVAASASIMVAPEVK